MHIHTRNVNTAFRDLVHVFDNQGVTYEGKLPFSDRTSRNGRVLVIDEPMTITYSHPKERVIFNPVRDANPMFHLFESLWMLAGRNDVRSLAYYLPKIKEFSDDGKVFNGAYGYRWRRVRTPGEIISNYSDERDGGGITGPGETVGRIKQRVDIDQLDLLVRHLKADPTSRRAVLQMWNVEDDLLKIGQPNPRGEIGPYRIGNTLQPSSASKDVCCNLSVMFSIREYMGPESTPSDDFLDMTVTNRSNDLMWGMLGANYVHFTVLQEYMAARLNVQVGNYHHITNNLHVYADRPDWKPKELLNAEYIDYAPSSFNLVPLVQSPEAFERELHDFVDRHSTYGWGAYSEPFLMNVAQPVCMAYHRYRLREYAGAKSIALQIQDDAWRLAVLQWLDRREQRRMEKESVKNTKVLVHADGGNCHGTPLVNGVCPKCGIRPDMQSTELWEIK